jgi:hypothetical protein
MLTNEFDPILDLQKLLDSSWKEILAFPKPNIIIANDVEEAISRIEYRTIDVVIISATSSEQITMRGNWIYYDSYFPVLITIFTSAGRQRIRNLYKEIRAILFINKHSFSNYQLVRPMSYKELVGTDLNIWRAEFNIRFENNAISAESQL